MAVRAVALFALLALVKARAVYDLDPPHMVLDGTTLHMSIPDEPGIAMFAVHYSINKELPGVNAGDYNFDITEPTGDRWVHENNNWVDGDSLLPGDVVNYWILVIKDGLGEQLTDQSWVAVQDTTTSSTTTTTTTTAAPTTTTDSEPSSTTPDDGSTTTPSDGSTTTTERTPTTTDDGNNGGGDCNCDCDCGNNQPKCSTYPCLIFEDLFDTLDHSNWEHEKTMGGGGNWEFQFYTNNRSNSYVRDGILYLKPTLTEDRFGPGFVSSGKLEIWGNTPAGMCTGQQFYGCERVGTGTNYINPIQSARLRSVNKLDVKYGKIEVIAQMPSGDWIWPAIWLLPTNEEYGLWPASGEIDIVESRGNEILNDENGNHVGNGHVGSTLHWGPFFEGNRYYLTNAGRDGNFAASFHNYTLLWDKDGFVFYVDGTELLTVEPDEGGFWEMGNYENDFPDIDNPWVNEDKMAPFNREFYIIMNVAVGGTNGFFGDNWTGSNKPWNNESPTAPKDFYDARSSWLPTWNQDVDNGEGAAMKVDSVRVYKMSADQLD